MAGVTGAQKYQGIVIAGFGGQGILSVGRILAQAGMDEGLNVSWLPSYGPEMRGGTAYVHVILSDEPIGSPLLNSATTLIAMNQPSFERYASLVVPGGLIILDGSMVPGEHSVPGVTVSTVPATKKAQDEGNKTFANIILAGKLIALTRIIEVASFEKALYAGLPKRYQHLIPQEMELLRYGMEYDG